MIPKFRAYITYGYTPGDLKNADLSEEVQETGLGFIDIPDLIDFENERIKYDCDWYENDRFVLMQSTGTKDKNGKEIFEGDIIYWRDLEDIPFDDVVKVEYSEEFLKWVGTDKSGSSRDLYEFTDNRALEVIGNIYENKELL